MNRSSMVTARGIVALVVGILWVAGCGDDSTGSGVGGDGNGSGSDGGTGGSNGDGSLGSGGADGGGAGSGKDECGGILQAVVRDFPASHPDFEFKVAEDPGIVRDELGDDRKPVYAHAGASREGTVHGASSFDQWYRDVEGTNERFQVALQLEAGGDGFFRYRDDTFFPIDDVGFPDRHDDADGTSRNFHFTTEIHTSFLYKGGEVFTFSGDDDLWIFVNGKLALDIGGVHGVIERTIDFDAMADELGIERGKKYPMDIFHAERHTRHSNFRIETNIECFDVIVI